MRFIPHNILQNLVLLNERTSTVLGSERFRYGFNGMESDNEVRGDGNSYTTEFRQYDPRIGRWLSLDPLFNNFPWQSPYAAFDNNPIYYKDPKGAAAEGGESAMGDPLKKHKRMVDRGSKRAYAFTQTRRYKNALNKQQGTIGLPPKKANHYRPGGPSPNQGVSGDTYVDVPERRVSNMHQIGFKAARIDENGKVEIIDIGEIGTKGSEDKPVWRDNNEYGQTPDTPILVNDGNIVDKEGNILIPKLKGMSEDDGLYNAGDITEEGKRIVKNDAIIRTPVRMTYDSSGKFKGSEDIPEKEIINTIESQNK